MTTRTARTTKRRGFTLAELSLVMVLAGGLMAITVPKAVHLRRQMELDTAAHRLAREIKGAHHEAVRRNQAVSVTLVGDRAYTVGTRRVALPDGMTFHPSSPSVVTLAPIGPVTVGGTGRFTVKYDNQTRRDVVVGVAGMITVE